MIHPLYEKYRKRIRRAVCAIKPCPFCGRKPTIVSYIQKSGTGYTGHFAIFKPCCKVFGSGRTELFFTKPGEKCNPYLWWVCVKMICNDWNRRV